MSRSREPSPPFQAYFYITKLTFITRKNDAPNSMEPHRGFGYVEFENAEDVKDAIDNMDQSELFGKVIKVSAAKPPKNVNEGLGSNTALWEQVCSTCKIIFEETLLML